MVQAAHLRGAERQRAAACLAQMAERVHLERQLHHRARRVGTTARSQNQLVMLVTAAAQEHDGEWEREAFAAVCLLHVEHAAVERLHQRQIAAKNAAVRKIGGVGLVHA